MAGARINSASKQLQMFDVIRSGIHSRAAYFHGLLVCFTEGQRQEPFPSCVLAVVVLF